MLGRRIICLLLVAAVGGPVEWSIFCLRCCFSGSRGDGYCFVGDAGVLVVLGQGSVSVFLPFFCGRVGVSCIPLGGWTVWVAEFLGDAGLLFRSVAIWLPMADSFLFYYVKVAADVRLLERLRLVENWATNLAALPMLGAPWRDGRWIWIDEVAEKTGRNLEMGKMNSTLRDSLVIFSFSRVLFVNRGVYCAVV